MGKFDPNDPLIQQMLDDPQVIELQDEYTKYVVDEYARFDAADFTGDSSKFVGGFCVRAHYSYVGKGVTKVELIGGVGTADSALVCAAVPEAINKALVQYNAELKTVEARVIAKQEELYLNLVNMAMGKMGKENVPSIVDPKKKDYLN